MRLAAQASRRNPGRRTNLSPHAPRFCLRATRPGDDTAATPGAIYQVEHLLAQPEKARGIEGLRAALTGRDDEFARSRQALEQTRQGEGQIVSLIGEAGVGKSAWCPSLSSSLWPRSCCAAGAVAGGALP